jgi:phage shock protein PspC (stress-responsive transcriptional regulator)
MVISISDVDILSLSRWLFILEGGITIIAAIIAAFVLPDYPAT